MDKKRRKKQKNTKLFWVLSFFTKSGTKCLILASSVGVTVWTTASQALQKKAFREEWILVSGIQMFHELRHKKLRDRYSGWCFHNVVFTLRWSWLLVVEANCKLQMQDFRGGNFIQRVVQVWGCPCLSDPILHIWFALLPLPTHRSRVVHPHLRCDELCVTKHSPPTKGTGPEVGIRTLRSQF